MPNVIRQFIEYTNPIINKNVKHYILIIEDGSKEVLLSEINLYLLNKTIHSEHTSKKYSRIIANFIQWILDYKRFDIAPHNVWLAANNDHIKEWQVHRQYKRLISQSKKPSSQTIYDEASEVLRFYEWIKSEGYVTQVSAKKSSCRPTSNEALLPYIHTDIKARNSPKSIKVLDKESRQSKKEFIASNDQFKLLMQTFPDPVYSCLLHLSLATALRPSGCLKWPYIGTGDNSHILPWEEMNIDESELFEFTVTEKGNKERTIIVNSIDWKEISTAWTPVYIERRKLFREKMGYECPLDMLWLTDTGSPVTEKSISDAVTYARHINPSLGDIIFYDARHWWATQYVINQLGEDIWKDVGLNAAVDEVLRNQLGHNEVGTSYKYYVDKARIFLALDNGYVSEIANEKGVLHSLHSSQ